MHAISRTLLAASCGILVTAGAVRPAHAQRLTTRADLLSVLGGTARTETFDDVTTTADVYALSATPSLDASTVFPGVGAGRIEAGVAFSNRNNGHWFFPASYAWYANPSRVYAGSDAQMNVTFTTPTRAFGVDLWVFWSMPIGTTVSVYDLAGQLVSSTTLAPAATQFFGWQHDGGISRVHFAGGTNDAASVRIDDLTFGPGATTVTPEPATLALAAVGLVALGGAARRRVRRS
jgi:hypothetical protein